VARVRNGEDVREERGGGGLGERGWSGREGGERGLRDGIGRVESREVEGAKGESEGER
jgi:hypothetical protein